MLLYISRSFMKACLSNCSNHYHMTKRANTVNWKQYHNTREYLISFFRLPVSKAAKYSSTDLDDIDVHSFLCSPLHAERLGQRKSTLPSCKCIYAAFVQKVPLLKLKFPLLQSTFISHKCRYYSRYPWTPV